MQGLPGPPGYKGDSGESGPPVRLNIHFSFLLASTLPHHAPSIFVPLFTSFLFVLLSSFVKQGPYGLPGLPGPNGRLGKTVRIS